MTLFLADRTTARLEHVARLATRHRVLVIAIAVLLTVAAIPGLMRLERDESFDSWLGDDRATLLSSESFGDDFGNSDYVVVIFESDDVFSHTSLTALRWLGDRLEAEVPYSRSVVSLATVAVAELTSWGVLPRDVVPAVIPDGPAELGAIRARAGSEPYFVDRLFSSDGRQAALLLRLDAYPDDDRSEAEHQERVASAVREILGSDEFAPFGLRAGGMPILNAERSAWIDRESRRLFLLALLAMAVLLALLLRSLRGVVAPLLTALLSIVWVFGGMGYSGIRVQSAVEVVPLIVVLAVSIGYSVHVLALFGRRFAAGGCRRTSIVEAMGETGWAILFTAATTVLALASFAVVRVAAIRWLGLVSAALVACTYPNVVWLLPAILSIGRDRVPAGRGRAARGGGADETMGHLSDWVFRNGRGIAIVSVVLAVAFVVAGAGLEVTTDSLRTVGRRVPYVDNAYRVSEGLGSLYAYDISITFPNDGDALRPEALRSLDALAAHIERAGHVKRTSSLTWIVRHINRALHGGRDRHHVVPDDAEALERIVRLYEESGAGTADRWTDEEHRVLRLNVELERFSTDEMIDHIADVRSVAGGLFPGADVKLTGVAVQLALVVDRIVTGQVLSFLIALGAICVVLMLALGSARIGLVAMLPNVAPVIFVVGTMALLDIPLHQATAIVAPMLLGIAVDDTIHYITRFRFEFERSGSYEEAGRETLRSVGKALVTTSIVVSIGFAVLMTSAANAYRDVAIVTVVGVMTALAADLLLTPTLVRVTRAFGPEREERRGHAA